MYICMHVQNTFCKCIWIHICTRCLKHVVYSCILFIGDQCMSMAFTPVSFMNHMCFQQTTCRSITRFQYFFGKLRWPTTIIVPLRTYMFWRINGKHKEMTLNEPKSNCSNGFVMQTKVGGSSTTGPHTINKFVRVARVTEPAKHPQPLQNQADAAPTCPGNIFFTGLPVGMKTCWRQNHFFGQTKTHFHLPHQPTIQSNDVACSIQVQSKKPKFTCTFRCVPSVFGLHASNAKNIRSFDKRKSTWDDFLQTKLWPNSWFWIHALQAP